MTLDEAHRLLELSREARWTFPSSSGRPVGPSEGEWVERLAAQREAFVEAARFLIDAGEPGLATELAANAWRLWILKRDIAGGRAFLATVLAAAPPTESRARALALYGDGLLAFWMGAQAESRTRNEAALAAAQASGDPEALALAHLGVSRVALSDGDPQRTRAHAEKARELARALGPAMEQGPLHMCAQAHWAGGEWDSAAALFTESLDLNRRLGDEGMVVVEHHNLGHVEIRRGNVDAAERHFQECAPRGSDDAYGHAMRELNAAAVAYGRDDRARAMELLARAEAMLTKMGIDPAADDQAEIRWLRAQLASGAGA